MLWGMSPTLGVLTYVPHHLCTRPCRGVLLPRTVCSSYSPYIPSTHGLANNCAALDRIVSRFVALSAHPGLLLSHSSSYLFHLPLPCPNHEQELYVTVPCSLNITSHGEDIHGGHIWVEHVHRNHPFLLYGDDEEWLYLQLIYIPFLPGVLQQLLPSHRVREGSCYPRSPGASRCP